MQAEAILESLPSGPLQLFRPFRVHLADGSIYLVEQPRMLMVGRTFTIIGIPSAKHPDSGICERTVPVLTKDIVKIEALPSAEKSES